MKPYDVKCITLPVGDVNRILVGSANDYKRC